MRSEKPSTAIVVLMIVSILLALNAHAQLATNVVIRQVGTIGVSITARSGSAADIQAAVNTISSVGGNVHIPAGTFYWNGEQVSIPNGRVNILGASPAGCQGHESNWALDAATTILHNIQTATPMFSIGHMTHGTTPPSGGENYPVRISGIRFEADAPTGRNQESGVCINLKQIPNYRIDHCSFINFGGTAVFADANDGWKNTNVSCYGVLDHCVVSADYKMTQPADYWEWAYGFYSRGNIVYETSFAPVTDFFGKYGHAAGYTFMFVEDCRFSYLRHCTDSIQGGYNVVRYNLMEKPACEYWVGMANIHGPQPDGWWAGSRGQEVYNNTFIALTEAEWALAPWLNLDYSAFQIRGGSGLCYYNDYVGNGHTGQLAAFATLSNGDDPDGGLPDLGIKQTYIWDNTYSDCNFLYNQAPSVIVLDRDYFFHAPTQAQDGFTYAPYPYPHPLVLQGIP